MASPAEGSGVGKAAYQGGANQAAVAGDVDFVVGVHGFVQAASKSTCLSI